MQVEKYDNEHPRKVLIGMITNGVFASRVASQWKAPGLFDSDWANQIGSWCVSYVREHGKAPNNAIQPLMADWVENKNPSEQVIEAVESFLYGLSDEAIQAETLETNYLLEIAGKYFNKVRLAAQLEAAQTDLSYGDVAAAQDRLAAIRNVELAHGSFCEPAADFSVWAKAFEQDERKSLVTYPDKVGEFFQGAFLRSEFYTFLAPEKTGKTAWLLDFLVRALRRKNKVCFFDSGDSSVDEILIRLACRLTASAEYATDVVWPVDWKYDNDEPDWEKRFLDEVDPANGYRVLKKISKHDDSFRLSSYPNSTLSVAQVDSTLQDWEREGYVPDVVVIDYADILQPPPGGDRREKTDETWKALRRLSQARNVLLMTATQADSASYAQANNGLLNRSNFSESKTKMGHVNGCIGINVSDDERTKHMARLNWVVRRKNPFQFSLPFVQVAGCYTVGSPIVISK